MKLPKARKVCVKLSDNEILAGDIERELNLPQSMLSTALTHMKDAPQPIRYVGPIRVYSKEDFNKWVENKGGKENMRAVVNEAQRIRRAKERKKKGTAMQQRSKVVYNDLFLSLISKGI